MMAILFCLLLLWRMPESRRSTQLTSACHQDTTPHPTESSTLLVPKPFTRSSSVGSISSVVSNKNILFAIPVFLTGSLRFTILTVLIQYSSNRFHLKISTGAFFYTETALVNMLLFLFVVPTISSYVRTKHKVRPEIIDLFVSRTCVCLLGLGSLLIGLSPSSKILPMGEEGPQSL